MDPSIDLGLLHASYIGIEHRSRSEKLTNIDSFFCCVDVHSARQRGVNTQKNVTKLVTSCPSRGCGFRCTQVKQDSKDDLME